MGRGGLRRHLILQDGAAAVGDGWMDGQRGSPVLVRDPVVTSVWSRYAVTLTPPHPTYPTDSLFGRGGEWLLNCRVTAARWLAGQQHTTAAAAAAAAAAQSVSQSHT